MAREHCYLVINDSAFVPNPKWIKAHAAQHGCSEHAAFRTLAGVLNAEAESVLNVPSMEELKRVCELFNIHPHYPISTISQIMKKVALFGSASVPDEEKEVDFNRPGRRFFSKADAWALVKESEVRFPGTMNKPVGGYVFQLDGYYSTQDLEAILYLRRCAEAKNPDDDRLPWVEHGNFGVADTQYRRGLKPNLY